MLGSTSLLILMKSFFFCFLRFACDRFCLDEDERYCEADSDASRVEPSIPVVSDSKSSNRSRDRVHEFDLCRADSTITFA